MKITLHKTVTYSTHYFHQTNCVICSRILNACKNLSSFMKLEICDRHGFKNKNEYVHLSMWIPENLKQEHLQLAVGQHSTKDINVYDIYGSIIEIEEILQNLYILDEKINYLNGLLVLQ